MTFYDTYVSDDYKYNKCSAILPESLFALCGEGVRDELMSGSKQRCAIAYGFDYCFV